MNDSSLDAKQFNFNKQACIDLLVHRISRGRCKAAV